MLICYKRFNIKSRFDLNTFKLSAVVIRVDNMDGRKSIREYYKGKNIFLTGGTGFIGKGIIEKLLRSCPDVNKIYVLVRPKKGKVLYERIEDIISSPVFNPLKRTRADQLTKIIPIAGDVTELDLGLSSEDKKLLQDEIHLYFHCAASVRFNDFLKDAVLTNLRSAREAALLALDMKQLEIFMHVSTTFCNIDNKTDVEERLYPPHGNWKDIIKIAENYDSNILNVLCQKFIGVFPNTYTYTKQLAEHCINDMLVGKVPTIIYRPSIVVGSVADPYQGWLDNLNGPAGMVAGTSTGLLRIVYNPDPELKLDYIPIDSVVKSMIIAAWQKANFGNKNEVDVFNGSSHNRFSINMNQLLTVGNALAWKAPPKKSVWVPKLLTTSCWYNYFFQVILVHLIPALFFDMLIKIAGGRPMLFTLQRKIFIATGAVEPFVFHEWNFKNTKTFSLLDCIPEKEKHEFHFDMFPKLGENFTNYFLSCLEQSKIYLLKEGKINQDEIYRRQLMMYYLDKVLHWTIYGIVIWIAFFKVNILSIIWKIVFNYLYNL